MSEPAPTVPSAPAPTAPGRAGRSPWVLAGLCALPGLVLAAAGLLHPHALTADSAATWTWLHVVAIPVFPLVAMGLVVPLRGRRDAVAWVARLAAYAYATFYTALDVVSGATAGFVTSRLPAGASRPDEVRSIFALGGPLGEVGSWALLVATVVLAVDLLRRRGAAGVPGLLLPVGAWCVHVDHIFSPWGALGMLLLAIGTAAVVAGGATTTAATPVTRVT